MDFEFPEELNLLRDTARDFLARSDSLALTRAALDESAGSADPGRWSEMAQLGWLAATIPEEAGGLGLGHLGVCVIAEEMGRALSPLPFSSSVYLATEAILMYGTPAQQAHWLPKLAAGDVTGTVAVAETNGPIAPDAFRCHAVDGYLSGTKIAVPDAALASLAIVAAPDEAGVSLQLVDPTTGGTVLQPAASVDPSRPIATVHFDRAACEPLPGAIGTAAVQHLLQRAAIMLAFEQLGVAVAALDMAIAFAKERYAFGRPVGSFQAIKHKLADVYVTLELAKSNAYYGAWALENNADELPVAAAAARVAAAEAAWQATRENIQTHGGMGFTWEMDCHLYYRRARHLGLQLGSAREWKRHLLNAVRASRFGAELAAVDANGTKSP